MPSLGETYSQTSGNGDRRLIVSAAAVLGGAIIGGVALMWVLKAGFGALGWAAGPATTAATAVAALALPFVGAGLLRWTRSPRSARLVGAVGVVLATGSVAAYVVTVPADGGVWGVPALVTVTYAIGAVLALTSPLVATASPETAPTRARPSSSFVRNRRSIRTGTQTPADGGTEEQELAFLLDTDDK